MTIPSMSSSGMRGKEARQSVPLGRVDLLLDSGEVEQSWDIGLGNWSVGSSPQCGISISGDSSIAPRHLELTVGKRYTLLKAPHPIAVAGRIVREFLIDRTTEVECGSRKLRIYPVGFSAIELGPVSVVTQERILEVASKLATVQSPKLPPPSSQSTVNSETSLAASSELKRQLDEMRMALEEMQARISAVSDSEALERRIQSLTSQSISAIEENLGQQMRQPLREEVADLLQQERRRWESELQQRLDSLEVQVRQTSSQVDESLKNARQDIGQINQRFQEFVDERGSARPILDEPQPNRAQASPSDIPYALPSQSEEEGDNAASMYDSDSEERELSPYDSQDFQGEQQDSESYTSESEELESEESESEESDEVLEFQVDDESIRLRLNRMLGEHVERRPPAEAPKAVGSVINVYNSIAVADAAKGISPPTDESSALSGRYLLELNHIQDPVGDAQDSSPRANGSMARSTGDKQAKGGQLGDSDLGDQTADEASIEEYMQRLLKRVRTGPSGAGATGIPTELPKNAAPAVRAGQRNVTVPGSTSASGSRASVRVSGSGRTATKPVPEVKSDIQALRELANSNARRAINRSTVRRSSSRGLAKSIIAGAGLLSGVALLLMDVEDAKVKFGGIAVSIIIALVWGFDTCKDIYSMLLNRDKIDQEDTPEDAPTGKTAVAKTKKSRETK